MPPNRVAVLGSVLAAVAAFLTAVLGAFHSDIAKAVVAGVALVVFGAVVITYLIGWQRHEARHPSYPVVRGNTFTNAKGAGILIDQPPANVTPDNPDA